MADLNVAEDYLEAPAIDRYDLVRRLKIVGKLPELGEQSYEVPGSDYTDPKYFEAELQVLFRKHPTFIAASAEMSKPGDFRTLTLAGVPLLFIRSEDGIVRGFRNTCRHRGAPLLLDACGGGIKKLICPYHAWAYSDQGKLVAVPHAKAFPGLDKGENGLVPVQTWEEHGLIFAVIDKTTEREDAGSYLGKIGAELDSLGLKDFLVGSKESVVTPTNWKLAYETFGESYHAPVLHPKLANTIMGAGLVYDCYAPHGRIGLPLAGILELSDQDDAGWAAAESGVHILFHYLVFPNLIVTSMDGAASFTLVSPGDHVGQTVTTQIATYSPDLSPEKRKKYEAFFDLALVGLTVPEDYPLAIGIYNSLVAGSIGKTTLGRCEWPLHQFHECRRQLMAKAFANA